MKNYGRAVNSRGPITSGAALVVSAINHVVDASWHVAHTTLTPAKALFKRLHYPTWIKKWILGLLAIRMITLFVAFVYYLSVTAATYDGHASFVHILFTSIFAATGGLFLISSVSLTCKDCYTLMHDGKRTNVAKRFSMNATMAFTTLCMIAVMVFSITTVGFDQDYGYTNDDDTDIIDGLANQVVKSSMTIEQTFDVDTDLGLLPLNFEGEVVERDRFEALLQDRIYSWCMFLLVVIDLANMVGRTDIYLITRQLQYISASSKKELVEMASQMSNRELPVGVRENVTDFELMVMLVALAISMALAMLVTALFPADLTAMLVLSLSIVVGAAFVVVGAYVFHNNGV